MKKRNQNDKNANNKNKIKDNLNKSNSSISIEDNSHDFSIFQNETSIIVDEEVNKIQKEKEEDSDDIFERTLMLMDEYDKKGLTFTSDYEPNFSINYPTIKFSIIPIFTPSTRLNSALQIEDKNECFFYYYIQKKSIYPTIYNQLIGISGSNSIFVKNELNERDFIWANLTSIIFTNQKNFIDLQNLMDEYIAPLMKKYNKSQKDQEFFVEQLCNNILIQEYFSYDELFWKLKDLNSEIIDHKLKNIGLIIIDGLNTITPHGFDVIQKENSKEVTIKFYKTFPTKSEQDSNKKNKGFSNEKYFKGRKSTKWENYDEIRNHLYGNDSYNKKMFDINLTKTSIEILQQNIIKLIMDYQEKYNFNLIITVFDFAQDNYYNLCYGGKIAFKDNKNVYTVNCPQLQNENCYFTFKIQKFYFPKKIAFLEPINLCLNYNENIFGLLTNPDNSNKIIFQVFKKDQNDYRPRRIIDKIEYKLQ